MKKLFSKPLMAAVTALILLAVVLVAPNHVGAIAGPTVTGVTSTTPDGSYKAGNTIHVNITFSAAVMVSGFPRLLLETGATDENATYVSGSGSTTLIFDYVVVAGDTAVDLDYVNTSSLSLNGGSINDNATNTINAILTLPAPAAANSLGANANIVVDTTAPTVDTFTVSTPSASLNVPITDFTASDTTGVTGYLITTSATVPSAGDAGWSGVKPTTYTVASSGSYTLYPWAKDAAGNVSAVFGTPRAVTVDATAPTVDTFTVPASSANLSIPITDFTASDNTGVTGYLITTSATVPSAGDAGWSGVKPTTYTVASSGSYTLYPWAKDAVGNVSAVFGTPRAVAVDATAPTVDTFTVPATSANLSIPISAFTASDNTGVTGYLVTASAVVPSAGAAGWSGVKPTTYIVASNGTYTLYPWAKDAAGNVSAVFGTPRTVKVDVLKVLFGSYTTVDLQSAVGGVSELVSMNNWLVSNGANGVTFAGDFMSVTFNPAWNIPHELNAAWDAGFMPFVNLMPSEAWEASQGYFDANCDTAVDIAAGLCDAKLTAWAGYFKTWAGTTKQAYIAPMPEMNSDWTVYASDGATYIQAYIRIRSIFTSAGVPSSAVRWVFAPNGWNDPAYPTRKFENYYPGDAYVDIVSFSAYNYGGCPFKSKSPIWDTFETAMKPHLDRMRVMAPSKPIFISQTGVIGVPVNGADPVQTKSAWVQDTFSKLADYPAVRAIIYFNKINTYEVVDNCTGPDYRIYYGSSSGEAGFLNIMKDSRFEKLALDSTKWNDITSIYIGPSAIFTDVPFSYWANSYIERLYNAGITGGCTTVPLSYCPDNTVTRAQMAIFLLKGIHGKNYTPPAVGGSTGFGDVPVGSFADAWIKQLAAEGITGGCGAGIYCPNNTVTRAQMAIFLLKAKYGTAFNPTAATGVFVDVPIGAFADKWIERLASEAITGGCSTVPLNYCPDSSVTRAQMAVFLVKAFSLP